tara:strand:+ start:17734 stop:19011 length:1278 start_codon:yes stop_codon:yes gene_type:complete
MRISNIEYTLIDNKNVDTLNFESFLWRIRNDTKSREFSINKNYISHEEHKNWLKNKLKSKFSIIFLITINKRNAGVVRFEKNVRSDFTEISIILSPEFRGQGLSKHILKKTLNKAYSEHNINKFLANIHESNLSSKNIFINIGFNVIDNLKKIDNFESYELSMTNLFDEAKVNSKEMDLNQKTVGIMQPTFLPWLGYFALMNQVDYFVLLDDVQVAKRSWQVRNRIKTKANVPIWLTLPVKKHAQQTMLNDVEISKDNNGRKLTKNLLTSFKQNYSKTEFFEEAYDLIYKNINRDKLVDITSEIIIDAKSCMGISTPVYKSSDLDVDVKNREQRLINIINFFGCKNYISPIGSSKYLELESSKKLFSQNAIDIKYLHFEHPEYKQFGDSFLEQMAIVDCIANEGYFAINNILELGIFEPTFRPKL